MEKSIALIELRFSHEEVLFPQLLFLKETSYQVHLLCSEQISERIGDVGDLAVKVVFPINKSFRNKWQQLFKVHQYLKKNQITKAVINTASGTIIRDFMLVPNTTTQFLGVLHDTKKLEKSGSQRIISRKVKKYFVLNDYLLSGLSKKYPRLKFSSFYCLAFPDFEERVINKPEDEFWICIPGMLEFKRRAYEDLLEGLKQEGLSKKVKFIILGNTSHKYSDGSVLQKLVGTLGLSEQFVFFDGFIPNAVFHAYVQKSDVLMPLIHPSIDSFEAYLVSKISGTFQLAFAYKKAMLMQDCYEGYDDFDCSALFYNKNIDAIRLINELEGKREQLVKVEKNIKENPKFSLEYQAKKYLDFIDL